MTRTRHTDPPGRKAARRSVAPRARRGEGDPSDARARARMLKELGISARAEAPDPMGTWTLPRIRRSRPLPGSVHPASPADIRRVLRWFGPVSTYGLTSIELRHPPAGDGFRLGAYHVPDRIVLFAQPEPPWTLEVDLTPAAEDTLERAGAMVLRRPARTTVRFPDDSLRLLMLFDGLFHEIGHHLIQHDEGKRSVRRQRTSDHERRAIAFARACRERWVDAGLD